MKIVSGYLPENIAWRVLLCLDPEHLSPLLWQLGLDLAQVNGGEMIPALILREDSEQNAQIETNLAEAFADIPTAKVDIYPLIIETGDYRKTLVHLVKKIGVDLLLVSASMTEQNLFSNLSCMVGVLHHESDDRISLQRILVPTSGSLNTAHRLRFLLPLTKKASITTLYVADSKYAGFNEQRKAQQRLDRLLNYVDAGDNVKTEVCLAESPSAAIADIESDFDLIVLGRQNGRLLHRPFLNSTVPELVDSIHRPVLVIHLAFTLPQEIFRRLDWSTKLIVPNLVPEKRTEAYVRIRRNARPTREFYILIILASMIAAFGLLLDSAAVIIGAMLVAPLMSPIVGTGMALVLGDVRFLRMALTTVLKGVLLAILVGLLAGLLRLDHPLTEQIVSRTQPGLLD